MKSLKAITASPLLNVAVGLILVAGGLIEAGETVLTDVANLNIGAHHGGIVLGLSHVLKHPTDLFEGAEMSSTARRRIRPRLQ